MDQILKVNACKLRLDGGGKYETKLIHRKIASKEFIIMAINIRYDVASGQFNLMILGGGVDIINRCGDIISISDCEEEVEWGKVNKVFMKEENMPPKQKR